MSVVGRVLDRASDAMGEFFQYDWFAESEYLAVAIIIIVGILGGRIFSDILRNLLKMTSLDDIAVKANIQSLLRKLDYSGTLSDLIADLTKLFIYLLVVFAIANVLRLEFIGQQMEVFISFLPRLLLALAVILVGFIASSHFETITVKVFRAGHMSQIIDETDPAIPAYKVVGKFVRVVGYVASILAALSILGVNRTAINYLIAIFGIGLVAIFVISSRDLMANIATSLYFQLSRTYTTGEIIDFNGMKGEIVSITPLYTKVKDGSTVYRVPNLELVNNTVQEEK
jgi:hypothetical protein